MWKYLPAIIIAVVVLLLAVVSAFAFEQERKLLDYIQQETNLDTSRIVPRYEYWTVQRINEVYFAENYTGQETVVALTINGVIILPIGYDANADPEVLLHELYHLAVFENGVVFPCLGEEERQAYQLQEKYVKEELNGDGLLPDPFMVFLMQCHHLIPR